MDNLLDAKFNSTTTLETIHAWLKELQQFIDLDNTKIFSRVVCYTNQQNKQHQVSYAQDDEKEDWALRATLGDLASYLRGSGNGTMAWICNCFGDAVKDDQNTTTSKNIRRHLWHSYLLLYKNGNLYI